MFDNTVFSRLNRGPQVISEKDAALIISLSGLQSGDRVVEAGSGSGFLTIHLAKTVFPNGKVRSYEKNAEFKELAWSNVKRAGFLEHVEFVSKDALSGFEEKENTIDLVALDLPDSHLAVQDSFRILKHGAMLAGYHPNVEQMKAFCLEAEKSGFKTENCVEAILRDWLVREKGCRPKNAGILHTAFISFHRKP